MVAAHPYSGLLNQFDSIECYATHICATYRGSKFVLESPRFFEQQFFVSQGLDEHASLLCDIVNAHLNTTYTPLTLNSHPPPQGILSTHSPQNAELTQLYSQSNTQKLLDTTFSKDDKSITISKSNLTYTISVATPAFSIKWNQRQYPFPASTLYFKLRIADSIFLTQLPHMVQGFTHPFVWSHGEICFGKKDWSTVGIKKNGKYPKTAKTVTTLTQHLIQQTKFVLQQGYLPGLRPVRKLETFSSMPLEEVIDADFEIVS